MASSDRRIAANRANAQLSTGPNTQEGKDISRANAMKHGLSCLVVVPGEEQGHVAARVECLQESLAPDDDPLTLILARQVAFLSVQLERGYRYAEAMAADRARTAPDDFDDARWTAAEHHFAFIGAEPITHHRRLMRTIEGVDLLIEQFERLGRVARPGHGGWTESHGSEFDVCTGRHSGMMPRSRVSALAALIARDDARNLDPDEVKGMDRMTAYAWAVAEVHKLVDAELDRLRAHRATLDPNKHATSRSQSPNRVLFGTDKEMQLYHRYQTAAARTLLKFGDMIRTRRHEIERQVKLTLSPPEMSAARAEAQNMPEIPHPGAAMASFCDLLDHPLTPIDASKFTVGKPPITPTPAPQTDPKPPRYTP